MIKVFLSNGQTVYYEGSLGEFRTYVNSANAGGSLTINGYLDENKTQTCVIVLKQVTHFHKV